jgi:hypothetical protein
MSDTDTSKGDNGFQIIESSESNQHRPSLLDTEISDYIHDPSSISITNAENNDTDDIYSIAKPQLQQLSHPPSSEKMTDEVKLVRSTSDRLVRSTSGRLVENNEVEFIVSENNARLCNTDDVVINLVVKQVGDLDKGVNSKGRKVKGAKVLQPNTISQQIPSKKKSIEVTHTLIKNTYNKFTVLVDNRQPSTGNVVIFITYLVKLVKELTNMKKSRRVELILAVIRKYIDSNVNGLESFKDGIHDLFERTLPFVLDIIDSKGVTAALNQMNCCS